MEGLVFVATALENAVSELHSWLKDKTHSSSTNKPEPGMTSGHKFKVWVLLASMPKDVNNLLVDGSQRVCVKGLRGFVDALLIQQDRHSEVFCFLKHKLGSNTY